MIARMGLARESGYWSETDEAQKANAGMTNASNFQPEVHKPENVMNVNGSTA